MTTTNLGLELPTFNETTWHDDVNGNFEILDSAFGALNISGAWANATAYSTGDRVVDVTSALVYYCLVAHTSIASPSTFADDRTANPTYWQALPALQQFLQLTDNDEATYVGQGGALVRVNAAEDGVEFADPTADAIRVFAINLGHASDTTLTRSGAGVLAVEGNDVLTTANGGLASIAGITIAANQMLYGTASDSYAATTLTAFARTLLDDTSAAIARATLGLVIGTNVQAQNAQLSTLAGLTPSDGGFIVGTGSAFTIETGATARTSLGIDLSAYCALATEDQAFSGGVDVQIDDLGTISSGTVTVDVSDRPMAKYTNNGAHTFAVGTSHDGFAFVLVTNGTAAGAITTSGFDVVQGDAFGTTSGDQFLCTVGYYGVAGTRFLSVRALQ